jgi:hypothetical protein
MPVIGTLESTVANRCGMLPNDIPNDGDNPCSNFAIENSQWGSLIVTGLAVVGSAF